MSFALDTPVSKLCFYSIKCTRQKVEKLSAQFLCLLISLGTWSLMRQSSSLMARRHITGMLFTARIYFINHCRWNELLWNPNIYIQTKPNPSADCSWVISQRFWKQKARIICVFFPWVAKTWRAWQSWALHCLNLKPLGARSPLHQLYSLDWASDTCASTGRVQNTPLIPLSPRRIALSVPTADSCWQMMNQNGWNGTELSSSWWTQGQLG